MNNNFIYNIYGPHNADFLEKVISKKLIDKERELAIIFLEKELGQHLRSELKNVPLSPSESYAKRRRLGEPKPTKQLSSKELIEMGYVGVYHKFDGYSSYDNSYEFRENWRKSKINLPKSVNEHTGFDYKLLKR